MNIEVVRIPRPKTTLHIIKIDGELHTPQTAALKLSINVRTLQKRIERGTALAAPLQRRCVE